MVRPGGSAGRTPQAAARVARRSGPVAACGNPVFHGGIAAPGEPQNEGRPQGEPFLPHGVRRGTNEKASGMSQTGPEDVLVVITNLPDRAAAEKLADALV